MPETRLLSGKTVSEAVYSELQERILSLKARGCTPGLAVILAGNDPASRSYVRSKTRRFQHLGLVSETILLPDTVSEQTLIDHIQRLNQDPETHGILVQLPLPKQIRQERVLKAISPMKDVDGFHPENVGLLAAGLPRFIPCTPKGILRILRHYNISLAGKHVVIVGRSNIVGRPLSILTSLKNPAGNATTTICHSRTRDIYAFTRQADVVVAALGKPEFLKREHIREQAGLVDVGINRVEDATCEKGYRIVGDIDQAGVAGKAAWLTPVPGGVGPMTVAMLVENTVEAAEHSLSQ